jgi:hypothetical protein
MLYQARLVLKTIAYGRLQRECQAKISDDFARAAESQPSRARAIYEQSRADPVTSSESAMPQGAICKSFSVP